MVENKASFSLSLQSSNFLLFFAWFFVKPFLKALERINLHSSISSYNLLMGGVPKVHPQELIDLDRFPTALRKLLAGMVDAPVNYLQ